MQFAHEVGGDGGTGGDAGSEVLEPFVGDGTIFDEVEAGEEHGGDAVEGGCLFGLNGVESGERVEGFGGKDDGRTVCRGGHVAEDTAEAVKEGWWADYDVFRGQKHSVTDLVAVVEDGTMGKTRCFGCGCCAGSELDVDDVSVGKGRIGLRGVSRGVGGDRAPRCESGEWCRIDAAGRVVDENDRG